MKRNKPTISRQSTLSITPPNVKTRPIYSALNAFLRAVKKRAPKGATIAMKLVITKRWILTGEALKR